jgi:hypothetical protein
MAKRLKPKDAFLIDQDDDQKQEKLARVVQKTLNEYEQDYSWKPAISVEQARSVAEIVKFAESDKSIDIEARVLCVTSDGVKHRKLNRAQFLEHYKGKEAEKLLESDGFGFSQDAFTGNNLVGNDFIPLLGGPFNKQTYITDYLRQHMTAFHASNHDPFAKRVISITRQFVLGKGFRIDVTGGKDKEIGAAILEALEKVNNLQELMSNACTELSIFGEIMVYKIPNNMTKIAYQIGKGKMPPVGYLPRYRLYDPSMVWEIVTYPEDITRVLYYQVVSPTQYQIYTNNQVPALKFIIQQIPAEQIKHYKVNVVSNEKRGRSDLYPILGYLKRMRDSINYQIIADQKAAAWAIDTSIDGSPQDIDAYVADQQALGPIAPAGSEFVHSSKITRQYLANQGSARGESASFDWCLDAIAAGSGIPVSYFGTHKSGGQTRASAVVGTEPVTKMFEERQLLLENVLRGIFDDALNQLGLDVEYEITWPELITQDRSSKLKDIMAVQSQGYISKERAASIIAKELNITEYDFDLEKEDMAAEAPKDVSNPLSMKSGEENPNKFGSDEKQQVSKNKGF